MIMDEILSNPIPLSDDDLQPEYRFDYRKAKPNRFVAGNHVEKLKVVVIPSTHPICCQGDLVEWLRLP